MLPPPHKKILKVNSSATTKVKVAPPCAVTVSIIGTGTYDCPNGYQTFFYTAGGTCTRSSGYSCELAFIAASSCANSNLATNLAAEKAKAAANCAPFPLP
jgi:hypothetical protein